MDRPVTLTPPRPAATPQVRKVDETLATNALLFLAAPIGALLSTREEEAALVDRTMFTLFSLNGATGFFKIAVRAASKVLPADGFDPVLDKACAPLVGAQLAMTQVYMSWWLSAAVQSDLDAQLCDIRNKMSLADLMRRLSGF